MNYFLQLKAIYLIVFLAIATGSGCATKETPKTTTHISEDIQRVVVLPAEVFIILKTFAGDNKRLSEKEVENARLIQDISKLRVIDSGYELVEFDFEGNFMRDPDLAYLLNQFREDLVISARDASHFSPVGESARTLSKLLAADALLFINYQGIHKDRNETTLDRTKGFLLELITFGLADSDLSQTSAHINAFLIDGISSNILWRNGVSGEEDMQTLDAALNGLPVVD